MVVIPIIDLESAIVTRDAKGTMMIMDEKSNISIKIESIAGTITRLTIIPRNGHKLTSSGLGRIPMNQLTRMVRISEHPNDLIWQHSVAQKGIGERSWPDSHWAEVRDVYLWAKKSHRPGGASKAISDLWGVARHPTAKRWISETLRRVRDGRLPSISD